MKLFELFCFVLELGVFFKGGKTPEHLTKKNLKTLMSNITYCWEEAACVRENSALVVMLWKGWFRKLTSKYVIYHPKWSIWKNKSFPSDGCSAIWGYCECSSWRDLIRTKTNACEKWRKENTVFCDIFVNGGLTIFTFNGNEFVLDSLQNFWFLCSVLSVGIIYTSRQLFSTLKTF